MNFGEIVLEPVHESVEATTDTAVNKQKNSKSMKLKKKEINLILVDDDREDLLYLEELLEEVFGQDIDFDIDTSSSFIDAEYRLKANHYDLAVLDFKLGYEDGIKLYDKVKQYHPNMPVIFVTGQGNERVATDAFKHGAADYIIKDDLNHKLIKEVFGKFIKVPRPTNLVKSMRKFISSSKKLEENHQLFQSVDKLVKFKLRKSL